MIGHILVACLHGMFCKVHFEMYGANNMHMSIHIYISNQYCYILTW